MANGPIGDELLAALEVAVLEEESAGTLRPVGKVPEWFRRFRPAAVSAPETLGKALGAPFLENFLIDAEDFWKYRGPGRLRSGLWTEAGDMGAEFQLEASAVCVGSRRIILSRSRRSFTRRSRPSFREPGPTICAGASASGRRNGAR
jgi:hypothetical protein